MTKSRDELSRMLAQLEAAIPNMPTDRDGFFNAFEDRALEILRCTAVSDECFVMDELVALAERCAAE